jgi:hypothetical protein
MEWRFGFARQDQDGAVKGGMMGKFRKDDHI